MEEKYYNANTGGKIPTGLPGGFFIYEAEGEEKIIFADFYHKIQMLLSSPEGRRTDQAFIHFDIPNFKLYNERHGFKLGDDPLCEGVESEEHYESLKKIDCERTQGYYFGKPMPMEESRAFTREKGMKWEK